MAGAGYKLFNTGDVLTAAQVNTYLQEQTVMVFASAAARTTALSGVLAEGMVTFLKDTDSLEIYSGTAWVSYGSGDLTAITAGTGITVTNGTGPIPTVAIDSTVATLTGTETLTNKTIALGSNTVSGTTAQFNTALTDGDFATLAGTETLTNKTLTAPVTTLALNAQTATYTVVLGDASKLVTMSNAAANDFQIPTNASVAFPTGTVINVIQIGAGQTTIKAVTSGTTTISSTGATATTPKLRAQYSAASCIKVATDTWYVVGDIA